MTDNIALNGAAKKLAKITVAGLWINLLPFAPQPSNRDGFVLFERHRENAMHDNWRYGGSGELFPGLTWDNRPKHGGQ